MQTNAFLIEQLTDHTIDLLEKVLAEAPVKTASRSQIASRNRRIRSGIHDIVDCSTKKLVPELKIATVLIVDIRGFTQFTLAKRPTQIVALLNFFFTRMVNLVHSYDGVVDKFMGDSVMAVFGLKNKRKPRFSSLDAVRCAAEMQLAMEDVNQFGARLGLEPIYVGIGLHCGEVVATTLGCDEHSEYTVIGDTVNTAARVEAHSLRGQVLLTGPLRSLVSKQVDVSEPVEVFVKGQSLPVKLFSLNSVTSPAADTDGGEADQDIFVIPRCEVRKSPRVPVNLPMQYWHVEGASVSDEVCEGEILDLGYYGMRAKTSECLEPLENIKFPFSLATASPGAHDIYAKVLRTNKVRGEYVSSLEFTAIPDLCERSLHSFIDRTLA